ncbi:MAG: hypothetical protein Q9210_007034 [Variospora velana]
MSGQILPAGPPPAGTVSNFDDPVDNASNLIACNIILLVVSIIVVGARILSRTVFTTWRLGWDDYTIILALIGTAVFGAFVIVTTHFGLGKHIWDVPKPTYTPHYLWWIMATFAACPASYYFVKLSILFFYLRVFELRAKLRYIIYALFVYCTVYYGIAFFAIVILCNVRNRAWDITVTMNCFAHGPLTFAIGGLDLVADVMVLAFPVPMVLRLKVSWAQRAYLLVVFLFGITLVVDWSGLWNRNTLSTDALLDSATAACAIRVGMAIQSRNTTDATMRQYKVVTLL